MISEENAQLRREIRRLEAAVAHRDQTIEAMLTISRCVANRVKPFVPSDTPRYPEIGTGRIPADPAFPTAGSSPTPTPSCAAGVGERAYQEAHA